MSLSTFVRPGCYTTGKFLSSRSRDNIASSAQCFPLFLSTHLLHDTAFPAFFACESQCSACLVALLRYTFSIEKKLLEFTTNMGKCQLHEVEVEIVTKLNL